MAGAAGVAAAGSAWRAVTGCRPEGRPVKKHVSHTLGKLGAANRTQAVARARALGLLE